MRGEDPRGNPAQPKIFYVIDDLVKSGGGVPEDDEGEAQLLIRGKIFPVPLNLCQSFLALMPYEPF